MSYQHQYIDGTPIHFPLGKLVCVGRNYAEHAKELNNPVPTEPLLFITQKYMHTPRGIFELKYFFSSHVSTAEGGECSSTAIRAIIKKLVAAENAKKPLSDSKIAGLLEAQGIQVARRTVAKYRESLGIAPSSERKRLV